MKKWLLAAGLGLAMATSAQAADKIAIVNMGSLFQQVAQKTGVSATLENEFKGRASELQRMESDLQSKMQRLQSMKAGSDRTKLEKDVMAQRQTFSQKAQAFEQDRARRSNEERGKLVTRIQTAVKSVASSQSIDLVVDANTVAYVSGDVFYIAAVVSNGVCINNQIDILAVGNGFHSSLDTSNQFAAFFVGKRRDGSAPDFCSESAGF